MHKVIDCPANIGRFAVPLKAAGVETVIRYYNHRNSSRLPSKRLEVEEANAYADAGLSIAVVFQQRGGHGGHIEDLDRQSGTQDVQRALTLADQIQQTPGSTIYFAIDHDYYRPSELDRIKPYFEAVAHGLSGKFEVGIYGSGTQARAMEKDGFIRHVWLAAAKGWSGTRDYLKTDGWALYQESLDLVWPGGAFAYDGNAISAAWPNYGQFRPGKALVETGPSGASGSHLMEVVARRGLRLRRGPGQNFDVETALPSGSIVHIISRHGEWMQVDLEGDGIADGFMHGDFLSDISGGSPLYVEHNNSPYAVAKAELAADIREFPGSGDNPRIVLYHSSTNGWSGVKDSVAWCSSFVNYCVEQAGYEGTNQQNARSWLEWGVEIKDKPQEGDIVVFSRGNDSKKGHVGFFVKDNGDWISILGGNQSDRVKISNYPRDGKIGSTKYKVLSIRRA